MDLPTVDLLGVPVHKLRRAALIDHIAALRLAHEPASVGYVNAHVLEQAARRPQLHADLQGLDLCYADGNGAVWASRVLGVPLPERMTGADWIHDLCARAAAEGWRLGWLGGQPGVVERAAERLAQRHPGLRWVYLRHGYELDADVITAVNQAAPELLLVGLGTPLQERWVRAHRDALEVSVVWWLGATADVVSGRSRRGPPWLVGRAEWLARLLLEPRRLGRRYCLEGPRFVLRVLGARALGSGR